MKGITQILLSPKYNESDFAGNERTHAYRAFSYYDENAVGVVKGPTQIILSLYYQRNALGLVIKGTNPDETKPIAPSGRDTNPKP